MRISEIILDIAVMAGIVIIAALLALSYRPPVKIEPVKMQTFDGVVKERPAGFPWIQKLNDGAVAGAVEAVK